MRNSLLFKVILVVAKSLLISFILAIVATTLTNDSSATGSDDNTGSALLGILTFFAATAVSLPIFTYLDLFRNKKNSKDPVAGDNTQQNSLRAMPLLDKVILTATMPVAFILGATIMTQVDSAGFNLLAISWIVIGLVIVLRLMPRINKFRWLPGYVALMATLPILGYVYTQPVKNFKNIGGYLQETGGIGGLSPVQSYGLYESLVLIGVSATLFFLLYKSRRKILAPIVLIAAVLIATVHLVDPLTIVLDKRSIADQLDTKIMTHYENPDYPSSATGLYLLSRAGQNARRIDLSTLWRNNQPVRSDHYQGDYTVHLFEVDGQAIRLQGYLAQEFQAEYSLVNTNDLACQLGSINETDDILPDSIKLGSYSSPASLELCDSAGSVSTGLYFVDQANGSRPGKWVLQASFSWQDNIYTAQKTLQADTDLPAQQVAQIAEYTDFVMATGTYSQNLAEVPHQQILDLVYANRYE